ATMAQLVGMYSAFANGGEWRQVRYLFDQRAVRQKARLCSPEAAWLLSDILSGIERPDLPNDMVNRTKLPRIAWKTGTSFGRRDAWAIGYNPRYTIGVWMGNMDGRGVADLSGAKSSVPLLVDLFNALDFDNSKQWFHRPVKLRKRRVCAGTGMVPGDHCPHHTQDYAIHLVSPQEKCQRYREIFTDTTGHVQYCTACLPVDGYRRSYFPTYPPELMLHYDLNDIAYEKPPRHHHDCEGIFHSAGPRITSPAGKSEYFVQDGQELLLQAASDHQTEMHYWYANETFLGSSPVGGRFFFHPPPGKVEIACMDDKGRMEKVKVEVTYF
ncbi:MAG: penicillin-binding protein 1C, partial [Bacteroidota bacterium]